VVVVVVVVAVVFGRAGATIEVPSIFVVTMHGLPEGSF